MADVKIPISADFDSGDLDKAVQQFSSQINRMAKSIAEANNVKFNPIDDATADDIKKVIQQFEALKRLSESFNKRLKDTGQANISLFDIDFHKLYENQRAGARKALDVLQYVSAGTTFASRMPRPTADNQGSSQLPAPINGSPATMGWKQVGGNVFHSAMSAAGPGGQVIGNAVSAGMSGGLKAGLFGLAGGFAALGVSNIISSAREKIGDAQQEAIGYDHLKRALGDVNIGFDRLKDSLRGTSDVIWETYAKGQELAIEYAKISGLTREQARNLAKEVAISGGFSWSFGLDTKQGNQFFAQMRQFKVTNSESDTRRFALLIGDGIAKSGAFSKADELMQAIAGYTANQARLNLMAPNVEGYAGMLTAMIKSEIPGLDPQGTAALLGRINAAIASGGGAGEAGQNFMYRALGSRLGLNPIETRLLQEGGAFASGASVFNSPLHEGFRRKYGLNQQAAAGSNTTNLEMLMGALDEGYIDPFLKLDAMSRFFGVNLSQAMALDQIEKQNLGGMTARLGRIGKNVNEISASGISTLANIEAGDMTVLSGIISDLRSRAGEDKLKDGEQKQLNKAIEKANITGDTEQLRDVLAELSATREMQHTEGSKTQQLIAETNNRLQDLSSELVPKIDAMKEGILHLAGLVGFKPKKSYDSDVYKELNKAGEALDAINGTSPPAAREPILNIPSRILPAMPESVQEIRNEFGLGLSMNAATRKRMNEVLSSLPEDEAHKYRDDPIFLAMIAQESGWRHFGKDGKLLKSEAGARGIGQVMPHTGEKPGFGVRPLQDDSIREHLRFAYDYKQAMFRRYNGDPYKGLAAYNWGAGNVDKHGYGFTAIPETNQYVSNITSAAGMTPLPEDHGKRFKEQPYEARITNDMNVTLQWPDGKPAAQPVNTQKLVSVPMPYGASR